jgi:hypothetical protein
MSLGRYIMIANKCIIDLKPFFIMKNRSKNRLFKEIAINIKYILIGKKIKRANIVEVNTSLGTLDNRDETRKRDAMTLKINIFLSRFITLFRSEHKITITATFADIIIESREKGLS